MSDVDEFHQKYGWGALQHHYQECDECGGSGHDIDYIDEQCTQCCGEGKLFWGSFYYADIGSCEFCKKDDVPIAGVYEDSYVCLHCYLTHHSEQCGCELWESAEALSVIV